LSIPALAEALNQASGAFEIGGLQRLRMRLHALAHPAAPTLFAASTVHATYAFHVGGRTELQFNIGAEERDGQPVVRHGVAFSLELSRSLPSIEPLLPKIARFNDYVRGRPEDFPGFRMWLDSRGLQPEHAVAPIDEEVIKPGNFIMLGRWVPEADVNVRDILSDFDRLLPLYTYVESDRPLTGAGNLQPFRAGCPEFVLSTTALLPARTIDVALRHKALQRVLYDRLCAEEAPERVAIEHELDFGVRVDAAINAPHGLSFYEVKVAPSLQACVRSAVGQLLEYAYWPSATRATELVVVGEPEPDASATEYLRLLRERFGLPLWYRQISLAAGTLGPRH
jgi:hypothetical protein